MNSKKDVQKSQKKLSKRYSNISENSISDSESMKLPKTALIDKFTPFSKIPAIGQTFKHFKNRNNNFMVHYHSDTDSIKSAAAFNSKIPIFQNDGSSKKLKASHLLRRNTYVVLEPIVCVRTFDKPKRRYKDLPNSNLQKQKSLDNTKLFGKAFTASFDSDTDMSAGDEMSPKNNVNTSVNSEGLRSLNYLLSNLKLSRGTETDLLLPKNNPWLL